MGSAVLVLGNVEEAADGAYHEAGLAKAHDTCEGIAGDATDKVHAEELHIGHGEELFGVKDAISLATSKVYVDCKTLHRGQTFSRTLADSPSIMSGCTKSGQVVRHRCASVDCE